MNPELPRGLGAGPVVAEIVRVRSVRDDREASLARRWNEPSPQLRLAEVAAIGGIGRVARVVQLVRFDLDDGKPDLLRDLARGAPLAVRIRRTPTDDRQRVRRAERV